MSDHILSKLLQKNLIWQKTEQAGSVETICKNSLDGANAGHLPQRFLKNPQENTTGEERIQCPVPEILQL